MNFYIKNFITSTLLLLLSFIFFLLIYFLKRNYFPAEILYNEGIFISVVCASLFSIPFFLRKLRYCFLILFLSFLINYSFIATFPTLIDRSISIMILNTIDVNNEIKKEDLKDSFLENYVGYKNFHQIDKRIDEQISIKNISEKEGLYKLTTKGKNFLNFTNFLKKIFSINISYTY